MNCPLLTLPRELRDIIYDYALSSSTGYIFLMMKFVDNKSTGYIFIPYPPASDMPSVGPDCYLDFSLLQTCKQIYYEARNVAFERNTVVIPGLNFSFPIFKQLSPAHSRFIKSIQVNTPIFRKQEFDDILDALDFIRLRIEEGMKLQTITLNIRVAKVHNSRFLGFDELPTRLDRCLPRFKEVFSDEFQAWKRVTRKLQVAITGMPGDFRKDPNETVKTMHDAFGGELWIEGRLCFKDGKEALKPFKHCESRLWQTTWFSLDDTV